MGTRLSFVELSKNTKVIGLDTAPFVYYIEDAAPYADLLHPAFSLLENHRLRAVTSTVTLAEILTKPFAEKKYGLVDEIQFTLRTFSTLFMVNVDERLAEAAALIRARYAIRLPDALQLAAALQGEATLFLTNDKRLRRVDDIEVLLLSNFL
jgi:predicted nucleic acid-binding protein